MSNPITLCDGEFTISAPFARGECASTDVPAQFAYYVSIRNNDTGAIVATIRKSDAYQAQLGAMRWANAHRTY